MRTRPTSEPTPADLRLLATGALTVKRAVAFSGIGRSELFELMRDGALPWFRRGTHRMLPRKPLVAYLAALYRADQNARAAGSAART